MPRFNSGDRVRGVWVTLAVIATVTSCAFLAGCGGGSSNNSTNNPPAVPLGPVKMNVLTPDKAGQFTADIQNFVLNNPAAPVSGFSFQVSWSDADSGTGQYDFSTWDSKIMPWAANGKKVNLIVWAVSDAPSGGANAATPGYVMTNLRAVGNTTFCSGTEYPNYFDVTNFQQPYQAFMSAVVDHYKSNASVGYIRFGLGHGGEGSPTNLSIQDCLGTFYAWSPGGMFTSSVWANNYLLPMLDFEHTLNASPIQLLVGISTVLGDNNAADLEAQRAVQYKFGFGTQGLSQLDVSGYPNCGADWCNLFNQYAGQVPLELQTVSASDPLGTDPNNLTGSLVNLLPFAAQHHATILELYWQDWLAAFDPNYPGYTNAYGSVFTSTSSGQ